MAGNERWYFSKQFLANSPSRRVNIDADKELSYRQQAANFIQDMGQRLQVTQLCINTAIVYMHRFFTFHAFSKYHRNDIASCALFLAAKVEEQPRKLEHVIKVAHMCLHRDLPALDIKNEAYTEQAQKLVENENIMLQTLGFDIAIEHPHTFVVKCCQLVRASKDLAQTSYFMATNSLHLTTMCLQYKPTVVACVCIHLACKWSSWEIPRSSEGKDWFIYVDKSVTLEMLEELTSEFLGILDKCPSRLKRKITSEKAILSGSGAASSNNSTGTSTAKDDKKLLVLKSESKTKQNASHVKREPADQLTVPTNSGQKRSPSPSPVAKRVKREPVTPSKSGSLASGPSNCNQADKKEALTYSAYKEKKEKEKERAAVAPRVQPNLQQGQVSQQMQQSSLQKLSDGGSVKEFRGKFASQQKVSAQSVTSQSQSMSKQQIHFEKQKQSEERSRLQVRTQDHLWGDTNKVTQIGSSSASASTTETAGHSLSINAASQSFFDSLMNKPASSLYNIGNSSLDGPPVNKALTNNWDNPFPSDGDDSQISMDMKKDIVADMKMEFSPDNGSNDQSNGGAFSLASLPAGFMQDTAVRDSESKSVKLQNSSNRNSFMSIFTSDSLASNDSNSCKPGDMSISRMNSNDLKNLTLSAVLTEKPALLSPLTSDPGSGEVVKRGSPPPPLSRNPNMAYGDKTQAIANTALNSSANTQPPISFLMSPQQQPAKIKSEPKTPPKQRRSKSPKVKSPKAVPGDQHKQQLQRQPQVHPQPPQAMLQQPILGTTEIVPDAETQVALSVEPRPLGEGAVAEVQGTYSKQGSSKSKEKHNHHHRHKHHEKHHKEKHKHKHKNKDRDKDKERQRDKNREEKQGEQTELKITLALNKDKTSQDSDISKSPIKLKISKKQLSSDGSDKSAEETSKGLRLVINKERLSGTSSVGLSSEGGSNQRKVKSSPKGQGAEKMNKAEKSLVSGNKRHGSGADAGLANSDLRSEQKQAKKARAAEKKMSSLLNAPTPASLFALQHQQQLIPNNYPVDQYQNLPPPPALSAPYGLSVGHSQVGGPSGQVQRRYQK